MKTVSALILLLSGLFFAMQAAAVEIGAPAPPFVVTAADGQTASRERFRGKTLVLFYETKDSTEENRSCKQRLAALLAEPSALLGTVVVLPVIDCSAAVWPLTTVWKSELRKHSRKEGLAIYGDWDGSMGKAYGVRDGRSHVIIVDASGRIRYVQGGRLDAGEIRKAERILRSLAPAK